MKYSKTQHEAVQSIFNILVGTDQSSRRSRKVTLAGIQKMRRILEAELRIKAVELETVIFTDDQGQITREIRKLKKQSHQTAEMLRHIAKHAADKEIAGSVTATLL